MISRSSRSGISGLGAGIAVVAPAPTKRLALPGAGLLALGLVLGLGAVSARVALKESPIEPPSYRRLTFRRGLVDAARFTSDGQTVVYSAAWDGQPPEVFTGRIGSPEWRSLGVKGNVLAVSSTDELAVLLEGEIEGKLARVPLAGGAPRAVLEGVRAADWSPDGKELAVARRVGGRMRLEYPIGKTLYQAAASEMIVGLRVSPAGDAVAFGDWSEGASVVALVDHSGKKKTLTTGWVTIEGLSWSPDGKEVWFGGWRRGNTSALYAVTRAGQERLVARGLGDLSLHDARRDGRVLLSRDDVRCGASFRVRHRNATSRGLTDRFWQISRPMGEPSSSPRAVMATASPRTFGRPTVLPPCASARAKLWRSRPTANGRS